MKRTGVVTVRSSTPADEEHILSLARPSFGRYSSAPGRSVAGMMASRAARTVVAEAEGRFAGFAVVSFQATSGTFGPWVRPVVASLDAIAVEERARGRGVGAALLAEVERVARGQQAVCVTLRTAVTNTAAQSLFRRAGFLATARLESFYHGGQGAFAMTKLLAT